MQITIFKDANFGTIKCFNVEYIYIPMTQLEAHLTSTFDGEGSSSRLNRVEKIE